MEFIRSLLSHNLLAYRKKFGKSQTEIATALGISHVTYGRWENGNNWPDPESLEKLALFYGIRSSNFFYDSEIDNPNLDQTWANRPAPKEIAQKLQEIADLLK